MRFHVVGGGLAGCEAAYRFLRSGHEVVMHEMRGVKASPCHSTDGLAELVCSNSLKSEAEDTASGLLKAELRALDCMLLDVADKCRVPAGGALAVDREAFSEQVERRLFAFDGFSLVREEVTSFDDMQPVVIASGPLTSDALADELARKYGAKYIGFYDAVAPIVDGDSIDLAHAFGASRYGRGGDDYLNCPLTRDEYYAFWRELCAAKTATLRDFDKGGLFEACMPVEEIARRGADTLRFGPLKAAGLKGEDGKTPFAVLQLRKENVEGAAYNLVGFQTNLTFGEQKRVFGMIPALAHAEFLRYGVMHRNTYLYAPAVMDSGFVAKDGSLVAFAGQMTGVEGYVESIASGLMAAENLRLAAEGKGRLIAPPETVIGQLQRHVARESADYQPMNANFGLLPPLGDAPRDKKQRKLAFFERGADAMRRFLDGARKEEIWN
ncbi:MAG TPA: methylenetetrahydrofolate--tRNA-(uracil(54)-C(5))-methyltransferase (FADH(2)-oxidizing) TrmFO [Candidatus Ornithoclostridium faecigallinarum]|nr:methylenetetrahydrofolate--tRNA-(uracil(54)-C(5))-methyltransferase (FADH(2)-oxidizing) TrmFO [Candidatus Ornithoclostridium faecigallinarum]